MNVKKYSTFIRFATKGLSKLIDNRILRKAQGQIFSFKFTLTLKQDFSTFNIIKSQSKTQLGLFASESTRRKQRFDSPDFGVKSERNYSDKYDSMSLSELQTEIERQLMSLRRSIRQKMSQKSTSHQSSASSPDSSQRGLVIVESFQSLEEVINELSMLCNSVYKIRLKYSEQQCGAENTTLHLEKQHELIYQTQLQIISGLQFIVSGIYDQDSEFEAAVKNREWVPNPYVGTLLKTTADIIEQYIPTTFAPVSVHVYPLNREEQNQFAILENFAANITEVLDLYTSSYIHMMADPIEHFQVYEALGILNKMRIYPNREKVNEKIRKKYYRQMGYRSENFDLKTPVMFHKSFTDPRNISTLYQSGQYNYSYDDIDSFCYDFIRQTIRQKVVLEKVKPVVDRICAEFLDLPMKQERMDGIRKLSSKYFPDIFVRVYSEYVRLFVLYQVSSLEEILTALKRLVYIVVQFRTVIQESHGKKLTTTELKNSFCFLFYYSLYLKQEAEYLLLKSQQPLEESARTAETLDSIHELLLGEYLKNSSPDGEVCNLLGDFCPQGQPLYSEQFVFPKIVCLKVELLAKLFTPKTVEQYPKVYQKMKNYIISLQVDLENQLILVFRYLPYQYLLWLYERYSVVRKIFGLGDRSEKLIEQSVKQICDTACYPWNKLSCKNQVWSIVPLINSLHLHSKKPEIHEALCEWLCSHTTRQILSQNHEELCDLFAHLGAESYDNRIYVEFFKKMAKLSLGEFCWQPLNKLYYYSIFYYYKPFYKEQDSLEQKQLKAQQLKELREEVSEDSLMDVEYVRRYILNEYLEMGINRRAIPTDSYFFKILEIQSPEKFYHNYFENHGNR